LGISLGSESERLDNVLQIIFHDDQRVEFLGPPPMRARFLSRNPLVSCYPDKRGGYEQLVFCIEAGTRVMLIKEKKTRALFLDIDAP